MALQTGAPIYPVYIHGYYRFFHPIYMAVGDPIDVRAMIDGAPDSEKIQKLNDLMRDRVEELRLKLEASIPEKEVLLLRAYKASNRAALAAKAEARARAWRESQEKKPQ